MSKGEFQHYFLRDTGISVEDAEMMGLDFAPCTCGINDCPGWRPTIRPVTYPTVGARVSVDAVPIGTTD